MPLAQNVDIEKRVERTIANLERHNFSAVFVANESQLHAKMKEWVPENSTVAVGDSMTLFETGVIELLRNGKYNFLDKYLAEITREEKKQIYRQSFSADTFYAAPTP